MADRVQTHLITMDEFFQTYPESTQIIELIEGEVFSHPMPKALHSAISSRLVYVLYGFVIENNLGEVRTSPNGFILDEHNVPEPDLAFISKDNTNCRVEEDGYWHGAPDLIVEIISPSSTRRDRTTKPDLYARHGVHEYWLIEPEVRYMEVYTLENGTFKRIGDYDENDTFTSPLLPGLEIKVADIFPPKV